MNKKKYIYIIISVPIISVGHSLGVSKGGEYIIFIKKINLKIIPEFILYHMDIDISHLDIGDNLYIKNIYNPKYIILHNCNDVIASVKSSKTSIKEGELKADIIKIVIYWDPIKLLYCLGIKIYIYSIMYIISFILFYFFYLFYLFNR